MVFLILPIIWDNLDFLVFCKRLILTNFDIYLRYIDRNSRKQISQFSHSSLYRSSIPVPSQKPGVAVSRSPPGSSCPALPTCPLGCRLAVLLLLSWLTPRRDRVAVQFTRLINQLKTNWITLFWWSYDLRDEKYVLPFFVCFLSPLPVCSDPYPHCTGITPSRLASADSNDPHHAHFPVTAVEIVHGINIDWVEVSSLGRVSQGENHRFLSEWPFSLLSPDFIPD